MSEKSDQYEPLGRATLFAGSIVAVTGVSVMMAWAMEWEAMKRIAPGQATMKFNTALGLALLGIALVAGAASRWARVASGVVGTIVVLTLAEYATGWNFGIDEIFFNDVRGGTSYPGRMAVTTATCLLLGVVALADLQRGDRRRFATAGALVMTLIGWLGCLGYLYGVEALYDIGPFSTMAGHTAIATVILGFGLLASVPDGLLPWIVRADDPGAALLRRILPLAAFGVPALGAARLAGQNAGWYRTEFGLAIMVVTSSLAIAAVSVHSARIVSRSHGAQRRANRVLAELNATLETRVAERTAALASSEAWSRALAGAAPVGIFRTDSAGGCTYVNERWSEIYGLTAGEAAGDGWVTGVHPDDRARVFSEWADAAREGAAFEADFRVVRPSGTVAWVHAHAVGVDDYGAVGFIGTVEDVTNRKLLEAELQHLALVDELTGLNNRRGFLAAAEPLVRLAQREGRSVALVYVDLDGMKAINDRYGHLAGDQALAEAAELLRSTFRKSDVIARLGGDEFCVLLAGEEIERKASIDRLLEHARAGETNGPISMSIGIAEYDALAPVPIETLLERADTAMYAEKVRKKRVTSPGA